MSIDYDHLTDGDTWIQSDREPFTQVCCSCGSAHNFELTILNREEIKVQVYRNDPTTAEARKKHLFDFQPRTLREMYGALIVNAALDKNWDKVKRVAKALRKAGNDDQAQGEEETTES